jgi:glycosyltransferase involved in cell wall biosynthesis
LLTGNQVLEMRIAYMMSRFPRITETFILFEIVELIRQGLDIRVYPLLREQDTVQHPDAEDLMARVQYLPFLSPAILGANLSYLLRRPRVYLRMLAEVVIGTFRSANFFFGTLGILPKTVRFAYLMERDGIEHIHAHFATHPALAALIIHRLTGIPFSFTAHGSDIHIDQSLLGPKIVASAFTVMISDYNQQFVLDHTRADLAPKMRIVRCGVDPDVFTERSGDRDPHAPFQILCVASFRDVKGHRYLIEACARLQERGLPFTCHLVGDGPLRATIEKQVRRLRLQDRITLHGSQSRPDVVRRMQSADVVVLPSILAPRGNREGIPVTLMEAMACGLPVVSSRLSGIPELVKHRETGLLTEPTDSVAIADALQQLAEDPTLCRSLGKAGRAWVQDAFDFRTNTTALATLFRNTRERSGTAVS